MVSQSSNEQIFQLVYASAAAVPFTIAQLESLLTRARRNNSLCNVTGMLLYHEGSFFQVLECPEAAVRRVFERVSADPRHKDVLLVWQGEVETRQFGDWSMGFINSRLADVAEGFSDFLKTVHTPAELMEESARAKQLLLAFRDGRWRKATAPVTASSV